MAAAIPLSWHGRYPDGARWPAIRAARGQALTAAVKPEEETGAHRTGKLDQQLRRWARERGITGVDPTAARHAIVLWTRLHGLVSLDIEGNFAAMGLDPRLLVDEVVC